VRQLELIFSELKKVVSPKITGEAVEHPEGLDQRLIDQCVELLNDLALSDVAAKVVVRWNPRMRTTAGRAFWPEARIDMNPKLRELAPEEVQGTLLHELAHLVAYARAGRRRIKAHGVEWQQACMDLGIPGERATHSLPLPGRRMKRRWRYTCPECGEGVDRVHQMKRRAACYGCCQNHNGGYFHKRFRLKESPIEG